MTPASSATTYEPHLQRADVRLLYDRFDQRALLELLFLSAGFEIAHQYGDYRFVPFDRMSHYVVTVARRPRRSRRRPSLHDRHGALRFDRSDVRQR
jgi:hypothetical protein